MNYLYVDNFRGFQDSLIPIKQVNFLVGENSTGKSSILSIIKLLLQPKFYYGFSFDDNDIDLGSYSDIASRNSDQKPFTIGYIVKSDQDIFAGIFFVFEEREGYPKLVECFCTGLSYDFAVYFEGKSVKYYFCDTTPVNNPLMIKENWNSWNQSSIPKKQYSEFKSEYKSDYGMPLPYVMQQVEFKTKKKSVTPPYSHLLLFARLSALIWFAPIRTMPKRTYDDYKPNFDSSGSHTPYVIKSLLGSHEADDFRAFISRFGKLSGLFDAVSISKFSTKDKDVDSVLPFSINIEFGDLKFNIKNVGYGVSQILPLIVEMYKGQKGYWYAIQQPEVHLHPKAQAAMGDLIFQHANNEEKTFLIETHSDYTIDRFRQRLGKQKHTIDSQILFFNRENGHNKVTPIAIDQSGVISAEQPTDYRKFFIHESMSLLEI